jgi:2-keto-4-pentenoate hydratase/2-oxohepta-3-ene-1,7-dioic acid hydratase in catechol pathway
MKLMRVGLPAAERPAVMLDDGRVVDVSTLIADFTPAVLGRATLESLSDQVTALGEALPLIDPQAVRVGPPLHGIGKIVCVGLNFRKHAEEAGLPIPLEPVLFMKAPDTVVGAHDPVLIPPLSGKTDYEVELAIVIGRTARYLSPNDQPLDYVAGYAVSNDVSEREYQMERGGQWDKGKNCETFNPLGPMIITADEIDDVQNLRMISTVNGEVRQNSTTADMIFSVEEIVRYVSQFMVLYPGDVINTGTPEGVGAGFNPPRFLTDGDIVTVEIEGLGKQTQTFVRGSAGRHS